MAYVKPEDWVPSPSFKLDDNTLDIIKSKSSMYISAGPGAGKTELLAQKATYLLTTGQCPPPKRILAIAFKVDASENLKSRVAERCDSIHIQRFNSYTLDAFAKRILDQFLEALPPNLRPTHNYEIIFSNRQTWNEFKARNVEHGLNDISVTRIEYILDKEIPNIENIESPTIEQIIQKLWWDQNLSKDPSQLTFNMIKYLVTRILEKDIVKTALQQTYTHVFLDEFQDVTYLQYELIKSIFLDSSSVLTAVGDPNQSIMGWAGAKDNIFKHFSDDFFANEESIKFNFRSNYKIVNLINKLAITFNDDYIQTKCSRQDEIVPENAIEAWVFNSRRTEGLHIASFINSELQKNVNLSQSDFLILSKMRIDKVEERIKLPFQEIGLTIRNEAKNYGEITLQDLVKDMTYNFLLSTIKLAVNVRIGNPYSECSNFIAEIRGLDLESEKGHSESIRFIRKLTDGLKELILSYTPSEISGNDITEYIFNHVNNSEIQRSFREYSGDGRLLSMIRAFESFFDDCRKESSSWMDLVHKLEGTNMVRLMTIHKSKGLEYHTVFFVEFNDDSFWGNDDDKNVFFVALSRARERVYFSFSRDSKGSKNVTEFGKLLRSSGVPVRDIDNNKLL